MVEVNTTARNLGLIIKAFSEIQGDRPIMLAYTIDKILRPVRELQSAFIARIRPFVAETGEIKHDLTNEQRGLVEEMVNEPVTFEIPRLTVKIHGQHRGLTVTDDTVLPFLMDVGVLADE